MIIPVFDSVENILGKGEIACTSNFSFSHNVFKRVSFPDPSKGVIVWELVNYGSLLSILSINEMTHDVEWSFEIQKIERFQKSFGPSQAGSG